ncbi:methyltransferase-like protein 25 [Selaginella moellendorffii]|uniref:methyltransferase-like protein 25 n=1 Tax=Selaginella moellendorffii TaxID=88036 RepID=UPI000D1C8625|nr:methyltransferase-like protein 25 [Selaginella moellendorffii]|eukprot:XP_024535155.1 methyltransferase-like protein 25 [Selaginella moellendorffii]
MEWEEERIVAHLEALVSFLRRHERLWRAHVVEFFQGRLWEILDTQWLLALRNASMEDLLLLPSHISKDCWPKTLQDFLADARSLSLSRELMETSKLLSGGSLPSVITQGVNAKKLHEIERLSSLIVNISRVVNATEIVDVGAGQGYLAQVLAFHHKLPVVAVDCSAHNTTVTNKRADRIQRYYASRSGRAANPGPKTATCLLGSGNENVSLDAFLSSISIRKEDEQRSHEQHSIVLAGLHACGDLSANMLRTFVNRQDVTAVISVGCCYNLLSENDDKCGFPLSRGVKRLNLRLGGAGRDLGCQSAHRWKDIGCEMAVANFDVHAFRAAFQILLHRFYPGIAVTSPSVGRIGKAKRRKQMRKPSSECQACHGKGGDDAGKFVAFQHYSAEALKRLGLPEVSREDLAEIWKEVEPFQALVSPFWSLRSAIAPVLETLLLMDRLLYLKEQESEVPSFSAMLLPVFDPCVSPRNMAVVATRRKSGDKTSSESLLG